MTSREFRGPSEKLQWILDSAELLQAEASLERDLDLLRSEGIDPDEYVAALMSIMKNVRSGAARPMRSVESTNTRSLVVPITALRRAPVKEERVRLSAQSDPARPRSNDDLTPFLISEDPPAKLFADAAGRVYINAESKLPQTFLVADDVCVRAPSERFPGFDELAGTGSGRLLQLLREAASEKNAR